PGSRRSRAGRGAHWRPASVHTLSAAAGSFVAFLASTGVDISTVSLFDSCMDERVWDWIVHMRERGLAPATIKARTIGLQRIMAVMYPFESWRWLNGLISELPDGHLESRRRKMPKIKHSRELLKLGVDLVTGAARRTFLRPHLRHVQVRDGVLIAFLA